MYARMKRTHTVLVIEDEADISETVAAALTDEGYRVVTAQDGQIALEMLQRQPPDAIVLDLVLPNLDGWQFTKLCRSNPSTACTPIIVVTGAYDALEDADVGSLVFVEKPFDLDILLALVEEAVSSPPAAIA